MFKVRYFLDGMFRTDVVKSRRLGQFLTQIEVEGGYIEEVTELRKTRKAA